MNDHDMNLNAKLNQFIGPDKAGPFNVKVHIFQKRMANK